MQIQKILDSIYLIPVILDHLEHPTLTTHAILRENEVDSNDLHALRKIKHLLEYHLHMVQTDFQPDYELLRTGLREYSDTYMADIWQSLGMVNQTVTFLDYGCGDGHMTERFLNSNPYSKVLMVDREAGSLKYGSSIDWEKNPGWYKIWMNSFDVILLSEVLHCKQKEGQQYLIDSSIAMLKAKGNLIVIENDDNCMEYRISKIKNSVFKKVSNLDLLELIGSKLVRLGDFKIHKHKIYLYVKI